MAAAKKLLVSGAVLDDQGWTTLLARVAELQASKHGPFDVLLVVGAAAPMPSTAAPPPLTMLVLDGSHARVVECEGIKIGLVPESALVGIEAKVDVLLTARPPLGFHRGTVLAPHIKGDPESLGNPVASLSALAGKPKYHFASGLSCFYQRAPYNNGQGLTRLVFLAPVGEAKPASPELKWLHALNLPMAPQDKADALQPGVTGNPYEMERTSSTASGNSSGGGKRPKFDSSAASTMTQQQQFFFASGGKPSAGSRGNKQRIAPRMDCWFCLASPTCEKHLIAGVGEEMYVALPKGGMQLEHLLIVPITHEDSFASLPAATLDEVGKHMDAITAWFASRGFACLFTERCINLGKAAQKHCYLEALPVPTVALVQCEEAFNAQASQGRFAFEALGKGPGSSCRENLAALSEAVSAPGSEYVFLQLPGGKAVLHRMEASSTSLGGTGGAGGGGKAATLPLQFGRAIACRLLGKPELVQWKDCVAPASVEEQWTKVVKETLKL